MNTFDLNADCKKLMRCLACGGDNLRQYLNLGNQPLANSFLPDTTKLAHYPLGLQLCHDCFHSQLTHVVNRDALFKHYLYVSGTTKTLQDYFNWLAKDITQQWGKNLSILDIASNDGSFLLQCKQLGHSVEGVDPAENLRALSEERGIATHVAYWGSNFATGIMPVDIIVAMNVLAHVPDPYDFLLGCVKALKPNGVIYIQTSQANIFQNCEFDTVYHEHHSFFTVRSMRALAKRVGLKIARIRLVPVHGESYLFELRREHEVDEAADEQEQKEITMQFYELATYENFQQRTEQIAQQIRQQLKNLQEQGFIVGAYGAAAKGNTFVNFCQLQLAFMIDDNPMKCGLHSPGMNTPVIPTANLMNMPEKLALLILAWNFYDEISTRILKARSQHPTLLIRAFPQVSSNWIGK